MNHSLTALGRPTFLGAYFQLKDRIALEKGWNTDTCAKYDSAIVKTIVPHIPEHDRTPLCALSRKDFEDALTAIRKDGYFGEAGNICFYDTETLDRFWYLITVITEAAEQDYLCRNVLADTTSNTTEKGSNALPSKIVPRYLSPDMEQRAGSLLLSDCMQDGELFGLASMLCIGTRNAEAAGLNFEDIQLWRNTPDLWVAVIYKSTVIDSNTLQSSSKTHNADRVVVLPSRYVQLVLKRKEMLKTILGPSVDVEKLPIACKGNDYFQRCRSDDLTHAAKHLFRLLGISAEQIAQADDDIQAALSDTGDPLQCLTVDFIEKSPTAYFLRRVFGTSLACVGLSEDDISFQIGHDLGFVPEYRNELLNIPRLLQIKEKIDKRPVVNDLSKRPKETVLLPNTAVAIPHDSKVKYRTSQGVKHVHLHVAALEPQDTIRLFIRPSSPVKLCITRYALVPDSYSHDLNVMADYHSLYKKTNRED